MCFFAICISSWQNAHLHLLAFSSWIIYFILLTLGSSFFYRSVNSNLSKYVVCKIFLLTNIFSESVT